MPERRFDIHSFSAPLIGVTAKPDRYYLYPEHGEHVSTPFQLFQIEDPSGFEASEPIGLGPMLFDASTMGLKGRASADVERQKVLELFATMASREARDAARAAVAVGIDERGAPELLEEFLKIDESGLSGPLQAQVRDMRTKLMERSGDFKVLSAARALLPQVKRASASSHSRASLPLAHKASSDMGGRSLRNELTCIAKSKDLNAGDAGLVSYFLDALETADYDLQLQIGVFVDDWKKKNPGLIKAAGAGAGGGGGGGGE
jgi:hypothetical protein